MKNDYLVLLLTMLTMLTLFTVKLAFAADAALTDNAEVITADQAEPDAATTGSVPQTPLTEEEIEFNRIISLYAEQVQQLERENGAYNYELVEGLSSLGRAYGNAGNLPEALKTYERALHINRINEGLHSLDQLPILELIIETNTALKNYAELSENYDYMLWLYSRSHGGNYDPAMVPIIERVANWHLHAYDMTEPPESVRHLIIASNLFRKAYVLLESISGTNDPRLIDPLYGIFNANIKLVERFGFLSSLRVRELYYSLGGMPEYLRNVFYIPKEFSRDDLNDFVKSEAYTLSALQTSFGIGRDVLLEIILTYEIHPELPRLDYASALLHLADWHVKFEQRNRAFAIYNKAYQVLSEISHNDYTSSVDDSISDPHPSDSIVLGPRGVTSATDLANKSDLEIENYIANDLKDQTFVAVEFDISAAGIVNNFDIIQSNPDDIRFRSAVKRKFQALPFRPKIENGQPTWTENVKMLYTFQN